MPDVKKVLKIDARTGWETTGKGIFFPALSLGAGIVCV